VGDAVSGEPVKLTKVRAAKQRMDTIDGLMMLAADRQ
jgi:hypothetical protein